MRYDLSKYGWLRFALTVLPCVLLTACSMNRTTLPGTGVPLSSAAPGSAPAPAGATINLSDTPAVETPSNQSYAQGQYPPAQVVPAQYVNDGSRVEQAYHHAIPGEQPQIQQVAANGPPALPSSCGNTGCDCCGGPPACGWVAPDLISPWADEEFLCDGGDREQRVVVKNNWDVYGLDQEDTVVHYDTIDGRLEIQESNRVCIYAPRFASVRRVSGMAVHQLNGGLGLVGRGEGPQLRRETNGSNTTMQQLQPGRHLAAGGPDRFIENIKTQDHRTYLNPIDATNGFKLFEDFQLIRDGTVDLAEKPRLSKRMLAAKAWTDNLGLQVILDGQLPFENRALAKPEDLTIYEVTGKGRLRVCKIADKDAAQVGDEVQFTIRFDNVGDQVIGNVTVIDNLTTRLEYIEGSQSCSVKAKFLTQENDGGSLILRWEVTDPLKVGKGGIIRFKCRVR